MNSLLRFEAMHVLYRMGWTLERIGQAFGLTRERVRQIFAKKGLDRMDGGQTVNTIAKRMAASHDHGIRSERASLRAYGCSKSRALELNKGKALSDAYGPAWIFRMQKKNADCHRAIKWELTFEQWCEIWNDSGKWEERGRGKDKFCMARIADSGPYSKGNVEIITNSQNSKDSYLVSTAEERTVKRNLGRRDEFGLTPAQRRILDLVLTGLNNKEVAAQLGITAGTVANSKSCVLRIYSSQMDAKTA